MTMEARYQIFIEREFLISTTRNFRKDKFRAQRKLVLVMSIKLFKTKWTDTSLPLTRKLATRNGVTQDFVDYIESKILCKLSTYTSELQQHLLLDGALPPHLASLESVMKKCIREVCFMTRKRLLQLETESCLCGRFSSGLQSTQVKTHSPIQKTSKYYLCH